MSASSTLHQTKDFIMRLLTLCFALLLTMVHAELWLSKAGLPRVLELKSELKEQLSQNAAAQQRNQQLQFEVNDLREGLEIVEEKARFDLGMVKSNEIMVQMIGTAH